MREAAKLFLFEGISFRVHIPFMHFYAFLFSCQFRFTSFHVPSISINHIFVLRSSYLISLLSFGYFHVLLMFLRFPSQFVSFSFSCSFHVPFILFSSLQLPSLFFEILLPFSLYVLSFYWTWSNFRTCWIYVNIISVYFMLSHFPFMLVMLLCFWRFHFMFPGRRHCRALPGKISMGGSWVTTFILRN